MTTAVLRPGDLRSLGQQLQERLQLQFFPNGPLRVRCARRQEILMVLGQHPEIVTPDTQQVFQTLEQNIKNLHPEWVERVQVYLKVAEQKQPYASHAFQMTELQEIADSEIPSPWESPEFASESESESVISESESVISESESVISESVISEQVISEPAPNTIPTAKIEPKSNQILPVALMGAGVSLLVFFGIIYPLTRPCVVGKCTELQRAKQLSQQSNRILSESKTATAPIEAKGKLQEATQLLKPIPLWSFYYPEAQNLIKTYEQNQTEIDGILEIQRKATLAAQKAQNPPHSLATWQEAENLWRAAIVELEKLSTDNQTTEQWKEQKIQAYQKNLLQVQKQIKNEQQAQNVLNRAKSAGQIAEARQGVAQNLAAWQQVHSTWQTAIKVLQQVPRGTMSHEEAKALLPSYQTKLLETQARKITEEKASAIYQQSLQLAENAQRAEKNNQWSQAVTLWQQAINQIEKVTVGTDFYDQSLPVKEGYKSSLERAKDKLQNAVVLQRVRQDLKSTCTGSFKVCDYAVTGDRIAVYISPEYQTAVRNAALKADGKNDSKRRALVDSRIQNLQVTLETISKRAGIALDVYDSKGVLIGSYTPAQP